MSDSWKLSLPCTRAEAEAIDADGDADMVLATVEEVVDDGGRWRLDAYLSAAPNAARIAAIRALVPSADSAEPTIERLPDEDWVTISQAGLDPLVVGQFVVHTGTHRVASPAGGRAIRIDAGQAFGTGHHETTAGCLAMLDAMADRRVERAIDVGTGTGLLAIAARHLWPDAAIVATDNDAVAVAVAADNVRLNGVEGITLLVADGAEHDAIRAGAPYDLVIANILAGPLIALAPELSAILAPDGVILLAGLLASQADAVTSAYVAQGCARLAAETRGDWAILTLTAPAGGRRGQTEALGGDRDGWATDGA